MMRGIGGGMMGGMGRGTMGGGGMGAMMGSLGIPDYLALLVNGRPPADPPAFEVKRGERVRLRLLNPSGATTYRVAIAGHRMSVSHADGRPVKPVEVDAAARLQDRSPREGRRRRSLRGLRCCQRAICRGSS